MTIIRCSAIDESYTVSVFSGVVAKRYDNLYVGIIRRGEFSLLYYPQKSFSGHMARKWRRRTLKEMRDVS